MSIGTGTHAIVLDGSVTAGRDELGGKAWGINRMRALGLPVPAAFVLPTLTCRQFLAAGRLPDGLADALRDGICSLEGATGRGFLDPTRPLLVSVRSGAPMSMPGMMDTLLNLGLDDTSAAGLIATGGDTAWVADLRRRFEEQYRAMLGPDEHPSPDPWRQLEQAVAAVFRSWNSPRAQAYRAHHGIDPQCGTAVTVQAMVFGNLDENSGTGVLFTRNPLTGDPAVYGEWLPRAQGEDVVSGSHTPLPLDALRVALPAVHAELIAHAAGLESEQRDVQDIEFTVEQGRLHILQTRTAKRAPRAAVRIAVELVTDGLITPAEALAKISPAQVAGVLSPGLSAEVRAAAVLLARGEPACPGVAVGRVVTDPDEAADLGEEHVPVVLVRPSTSPDDVPGMLASVAVVTEHGGSTSHAALVCRELGIACVVGCGDGLVTALAGRTVTVDGGTGEIFDGALLAEPADLAQDPHLGQLRIWCQELGGYPDLLAALGS
ncbi:MAG TPA: pyruvate, phosphate dikinase [Sporichthyaceae bacterium]|nr:pyruvate, phosphate dikinase [Sporichthyaceae bacterium]